MRRLLLALVAAAAATTAVTWAPTSALADPPPDCRGTSWDNRCQ